MLDLGRENIKYNRHVQRLSVGVVRGSGYRHDVVTGLDEVVGCVFAVDVEHERRRAVNGYVDGERLARVEEIFGSHRGDDRAHGIYENAGLKSDRIVKVGVFRDEFVPVNSEEISLRYGYAEIVALDERTRGDVVSFTVDTFFLEQSLIAEFNGNFTARYRIIRGHHVLGNAFERSRVVSADKSEYDCVFVHARVDYAHAFGETYAHRARSGYVRMHGSERTARYGKRFVDVHFLFVTVVNGLEYARHRENYLARSYRERPFGNYHRQIVRIVTGKRKRVLARIFARIARDHGVERPHRKHLIGAFAGLLRGKRKSIRGIFVTEYLDGRLQFYRHGARSYRESRVHILHGVKVVRVINEFRYRFGRSRLGKRVARVLHALYSPRERSAHRKSLLGCVENILPAYER